MNHYINTINTLNIDDNIKKWIIERSTTFLHQFIFYYRDLDMDLQRSINRAMEETDDIFTEKQIRILDILKDNNINETEKLVRINDIVIF